MDEVDGVVAVDVAQVMKVVAEDGLLLTILDPETVYEGDKSK